MHPFWFSDHPKSPGVEGREAEAATVEVVLYFHGPPNQIMCFFHTGFPSSLKRAAHATSSAIMSSQRRRNSAFHACQPRMI